MSLRRRWRIAFLVIRELAQKYTRALLAGFVLGLSLTLFITRLYPVIVQYWFRPVERVGVVGVFTPNDLPRSIQREISFGLTDVGVDGSPAPGLAESWVATDSAKTFTFYLNRDLRWHNNKPVVASDVNYNIKNVTFTVVDPHTLRASLTNAYSPFPVLVGKPLFLSGLRGLGAYKVERIRLNAQSVRYLKLVPSDVSDRTRNPKEYRFYPTEAAAVLAYKLGEVNALPDLTEPYDLGQWNNTEIVPRTAGHHIVSLFFNVRDAFLSDKSVRQALGYGVPKFEGERAYSPIAKTSWAYTDKVKKYTSDIPQARKMLLDSTVATQSSELTIATFPQFAEEAQKIADSWTDLGIATSVKIVGTVPSDYQVLLSVQEVPPDPDQYPFWHSTQEETNKTGFANVKIDKLLEDGRQELDTGIRKKIYADFQRYLVEEAPAVFLHYQTVYSVRRK